jgi:hypothetical protein
MTILHQVTEKQGEHKSASVAEHSTETGHRRKFQESELVAQHADYTDQPV